MRMILFAAIASASACAFVSTSLEAAHGLACQMRFSLAGGSMLNKTASGSGVVICSNVQKMKVPISMMRNQS